jgi:hypothetical protein
MCLFQSKSRQKVSQPQQATLQKECESNFIIGTPTGERKSGRIGEREVDERKRSRRSSIQGLGGGAGEERVGENLNERGGGGGQKWVGVKKGRMDGLKRTQDNFEVTENPKENLSNDVITQSSSSPFPPPIPSLTLTPTSRVQKQFKYQIATEKLFNICKKWSSTVVFSRVRFFRFFWSEKVVSRHPNLNSSRDIFYLFHFCVSFD